MRTKRETAIVSYSILDARWHLDSSRHKRPFSKIMRTDVCVKLFTRSGQTTAMSSTRWTVLVPCFQHSNNDVGKNIQSSRPIVSFMELCLLKAPLRFIMKNPPKKDLEDIVNSKYNLSSKGRRNAFSELYFWAAWILSVPRWLFFLSFMQKIYSQSEISGLFYLIRSYRNLIGNKCGAKRYANLYTLELNMTYGSLNENFEQFDFSFLEYIKHLIFFRFWRYKRLAVVLISPSTKIFDR